LKRARARGGFSTMGTPCSLATSRIRRAVLRFPSARTMGAGAMEGSHLRATETWVGFVSTTSASETESIIRRRARARPMAIRRARIWGSPSESFSSRRSSCSVMRRFRSCCHTWKA